MRILSTCLLALSLGMPHALIAADAAGKPLFSSKVITEGTIDIDIDITALCGSGLPVYIIAYNETVSCIGGYFDNNSPCASCPVMIDIAGSCPADINIDYMPPGSSVR